MDELINIIGMAQQDDGYLYVSHTCKYDEAEIGLKPYSWVCIATNFTMWGTLRGCSCLFEATGKRAWLDIAKRVHSMSTRLSSSETQITMVVCRSTSPGHQEPELALCRLYRATAMSSI